MGKTGAIGGRASRAARAASGGPSSGREALSTRQVEAVRAYQEEAKHYEVNQYLRGQATAGPDVLQTIRHMDVAVDRSRIDATTTLYRGFAIPAAADPASLVGRRMTDPAFLSTTTNRIVAEGFAMQRGQGVIFKIKAPAGTKALDVGKVATGSEFANRGATPEFEVLLPRGTSLRITAARRTRGGKILATAEIVP